METDVGTKTYFSGYKLGRYAKIFILY